MLKGNRKYILLLAACFALLIYIQYNTPKPIDWRKSYSQKEKTPYGAYALFELLPDLFPGKDIATVNTPSFNALSDDLKKGNYIFINETFSPDKLDTRTLLNFVNNGNNIFIAAHYFEGKLGDTLKLATDYYDEELAFKNLKKNSLSKIVKGYLDSFQVNFTSPHLRSKKPYNFSAKGMQNVVFTSFDTLNTTVLSTTYNDQPNFIKVRFGKGNIYLSSLPEAFTNYHFVTEPNNEYVYKSLSFLPLADVSWDEYYKPFKDEETSQSPIRFILGSQALSTAYFLLLISLVVFIIFGIKRKQRIIPVVEPLRNTTLEFVEIVGTLYYQKGDHKNMAEKKISYFLEYIRSTFFVRTQLFDEAFIGKIASLSGIKETEVKELFNFISVISGSSIIREEELLKLNSMISKFQQQSKR